MYSGNQVAQSQHFTQKKKLSKRKQTTFHLAALNCSPSPNTCSCSYTPTYKSRKFSMLFGG